MGLGDERLGRQLERLSVALSDRPAELLLLLLALVGLRLIGSRVVIVRRPLLMLVLVRRSGSASLLLVRRCRG